MSSCKRNSITHAGAVPSNLDELLQCVLQHHVANLHGSTHMAMRSAEAELQNTIELRATVSEIAAPKPDLDTKAKKKTSFEACFKRVLKRKLLAPKLRNLLTNHNTIYNVQCPVCKRNSITHAAAVPSNHDAAITMRFAASHRKPAHIYAHGKPDDNNHAAIPLRSATTDSKTPYNYAHTSTPTAAWSHRTMRQKKRQTDRSRNRRIQEVPSSPAAATLHRKIQGFRAPSQHKPHATFMQPLQCSLYLPSSRSILVWCIVMWLSVSHRPSFNVNSFVMSCYVV